MPTLSVLMTAYNAAAYIEQSIRSVLAQSFDDFVLIIVDDGSTDRTIDIISSIHDDRIELWKLDHRGRTPCLNFGLDKAATIYLAIMDADDLCVPWRFEKQLAILKQLPKNTILSSWYAIFSDGNIDYCVRTPTDSAEIKKGMLLYSYICHPGVMCNKNAFESNGGYFNAVVDAFEEYQTWLKINPMVEYYVIPEILMFLRYREDSLSNNITYKQQVVYAIQQPYYDNLQLNFGITNSTEEAIYRGWREFFYGEKKKARQYWNLGGVDVFLHSKLGLAWMVTFLPEYYFLKFKEMRIRYRLMYLIGYYTKKSRTLRHTFDALYKGK